MTRIDLENVSKAFPGSTFSGLHPTSLTIASGSFVTILGASGSGKTTLLKLINRLHKPTSGRVLLNGQDTTAIPETQLRRRMGYVIQQGGLFQHMTVAQNIAVVPEMLGWRPPQIRERVDELLALVGLEPNEFRDRFPRKLSGGQQQRVGLARALAGNPEILLMDEPFGAIDALTRHRLQDELLQLHVRLKKTVVFVTHDVSEALKLGERVIVMNQGMVQQYDAPQAILETPVNTFVATLLGSDDLYRHFELISARQVMTPHPHMETADLAKVPALNPYEGVSKSGTRCQLLEKPQTLIQHAPVPVITEEQTLNDALQELLLAPSDYVMVENRDKHVIGKITLDTLKALRRRLRNPFSSEER